MNVKTTINQIKDIFLYMEQKYVIKEGKIPILILGYSIFRKKFFDSDNSVFPAFLQSLLTEIVKER